ncbi:hypothetical protein F4703DRAFT_1795098 [Phycomyces blakesleeanus]
MHIVMGNSTVHRTEEVLRAIHINENIEEADQKKVTAKDSQATIPVQASVDQKPLQTSQLQLQQRPRQHQEQGQGQGQEEQQTSFPSNPSGTLTSSSVTKPTAQDVKRDPAEPIGESWPVQIRLSSTGQDISVSIPTCAPFLSVEGLRQQLVPHIKPGCQVKLIYLGKLLLDTMLILPNTAHTLSKNQALSIQRDGVIQAMVYKNP